jgi:ATP-dependent Clp protease ATP-binding subunit ClpA
MFERFTEPSRRVVVLAQEEARMLDHNYIGTEHILLGLIHEGEGVAARAIASLGLTLEMARDQVRDLVGAGQQAPTGHIPFTPPAKKVLELSLREALALKKEYIGTEHILLGLVREGHGVGAQILVTAAPLAEVREKVLLLAATESNEPEADEQRAAEWLAGGREAGFAGLRLPTAGVVGVRAQVVREFRETLASIGGTLDALDRRLAGIERQLGITAKVPEEGLQGPDEPAQGPEDAVQGPEDAAQAPEEAAQAPREVAQPPDRTSGAPQDEASEESAE